MLCLFSDTSLSEQIRVRTRRLMRRIVAVLVRIGIKRDRLIPDRPRPEDPLPAPDQAATAHPQSSKGDRFVEVGDA